jgi:hypothetical protein
VLYWNASEHRPHQAVEPVQAVVEPAAHSGRQRLPVTAECLLDLGQQSAVWQLIE